MKLKMALRTVDQNLPTEATADVIAILKKVGGKQRKIGLFTVEDKSHNFMDLEAPTKAAEARIFAEEVAVAQQDGWDLNDPVYMMGVIALQVTLYKVLFDRQFLRDAEMGTQRIISLRVQKLVPLPFEDEDIGLRGFDLSIPDEREVVATALDSISHSIVG
ncbi:hypothetical protein HDV00_005511 [Rhizophlyctis rosea]|nr:hypothetical protein HDV00_005511 [Rhizophlyctis rosea]